MKLLKKKRTITKEEKKKEAFENLLETATQYAKIDTKEIYLNITDMTIYNIEHIFCDYQTFILAIKQIEAIKGIESLLLDKNIIIVKVYNKDEIEISINQNSISITIYDICNTTPIEIIDEIMNIYKNIIDSTIQRNIDILQ